MAERRTTCAVVGGGPAGLVLGLLLARGGVDVTVLERHGDFLRDFRGDTVHVSTMTLLDELGLWDRFATLPWKPMKQFRVIMDAGAATVADFSALRQPHPFIAMVPQWHLLDMIAAAAAEEPSFTLLRNADVVDVVTTAGRMVGVRWRDADGVLNDLDADLVVACDGRDSMVRRSSGLPLRDYRVPMDVWWFRIPRGGAADPEGGSIRISAGRMVIMLDRGDYYQVAYILPHGRNAEFRGRAVDFLRDDLLLLHPWLGDRVAGLASWDDVKLLQVTLNRLRRWSGPGVLCIGDASHAMSPVAGVGINLAVQDAVATARFLAPVLRSTRPDPRAVDAAAARVQRRRWWPTAITQGMQRLVHRNVIRAALNVDPESPTDVSRDAKLPLPLRIVGRTRRLQAIPARLIGVGALPEHAPVFARRSPLPVRDPGPSQ